MIRWDASTVLATVATLGLSLSSLTFPPTERWFRRLLNGSRFAWSDMLVGQQHIESMVRLDLLGCEDGTSDLYFSVNLECRAHHVVRDAILFAHRLQPLLLFAVDSQHRTMLP